MDAQLGRVLDALEKSGHAENTVIVLWSDHGFHLGEKEITGKNTLWERSTRVPLMFAGPGSLRETRCAEPVELLDIFPTLCDLAGLPKPDGLEGLSLLPQLKDAAAARERPALTNHNPATTPCAISVGATSATWTAPRSFTTWRKTPTNSKTSRTSLPTRRKSHG